MIKLSDLISEQDGNGSFFDWTKDFDLFKTTINSATESATNRLKQSLSAKLKGKSVKIRASKGYKQAIKDWDIKNVTGVDINDFNSDWVVVLKDEFNKEFFLTPGYQIKVTGIGVVPPQNKQEPVKQPTIQPTVPKTPVTNKQPPVQPPGQVNPTLNQQPK